MTEAYLRLFGVLVLFLLGDWITRGKDQKWRFVTSLFLTLAGMLYLVQAMMVAWN